MLKLVQYLAAQKITQRAFASVIGADPSIVSRLVRGQTKPGLELAVRIERETGGAVPASSWVAPQEPGGAV